jgi:hypothetical protein
MNHATYEELLAGLDSVRESPKDEGVLRLIVRRPAVDAREALEVGRLETSEGRALNLRGINARVVRSGVVREGDVARKLGAVEDESRSCAAPSSRP